ncbi:MAG: NTP transferase domain-containing protein [Candidatus Cloacimonetes bacterium]|nr:NTP transferase domain-containing protein [Candidatus Cloacimonadota bacterium]
MTDYGIDTVILAAGQSLRMGEDKALLKFRGRACIVHVLEKTAGISTRIIIVLGNNFSLVRDFLDGTSWSSRIELVLNKNYRDGMFSSLKAGLKPCRAGNFVLVQMVDQPFLPPEIYHALVEAIDNRYLIFQPAVSVKGIVRYGHPLIIAPAFRQTVLQETRPVILRDLVREYNMRRKTIMVENRDILLSLNRREDLHSRMGN